MEPTKCQETKGPGQGKEMTPESLYDLAATLNICRAKVDFIVDVFTQDGPSTFRFSESGLYGFYLVLRNISEDMEHVSDGISENDSESRREIKRLTEALNKREPLPKVATG
ncbi:MAG: hypothetical protein RDU59_07210 [Thermodesulfobacteriota bacterium]|nr:hypothetical protein [Thermodesulfobacteriota bacterium]